MKPGRVDDPGKSSVKERDWLLKESGGINSGGESDGEGKWSAETCSVGVGRDEGIRVRGSVLAGGESGVAANEERSTCSVMKSLSQEVKELKSEGQNRWILPKTESSDGKVSLPEKAVSSTCWLGDEIYP